MTKTTAAIVLGMFLLAGCAVHSHGGKVAVCHKGKTLHVSENAVDAHLRHGDHPGPCR